MKRRIYIITALLAIGWLSFRGYKIATSRSHSPTDSVQYSSGNLNIKVIYGRPYKKGRQIFGEGKDRAWLPDGKAWTLGFRLLTGKPPTTGALVPNNVYWRLGANDATEISFSRNVNFAGQHVNAGRYRIYSFPRVDSWDIILNSELGQFGFDEPNHALDITTIKVPVEAAPAETEQFTIRFDGDSSQVKMQFLWDQTLVVVPIRTE